MINKDPKKILISGGWGYSNLGDDAILLSTVKLVRKKYPTSLIVVMTYDCNDSAKNSYGDNVRLIPSLHRVFSGRLSKFKLRIPSDPKSIRNDNPSSVGIFTSKVEKYVIRKLEPYFAKKFRRILEKPSEISIYKEFQTADLFIQAGGGYFLSGWTDSFYSRILELTIVRELGIRSLVIGQSMGPFVSEESKSLVAAALGAATLVSVRDTESFKELCGLGIEPVLIPDTVLSDSDFNIEKDKTIAIILGSGRVSATKLSEITSSLSGIYKSYGYSFKILVSRLWIPDISNAYNLYEELKKIGVEVSIVIPDNYSELQQELGLSSIVVSQNLHGLIMGWRTGCPSVSLNARRKFVSFMEQSNQGQRLISMDRLTHDILTQCIINAIEELGNADELRHVIAKDIQIKFNECLDIVMSSTVNVKI